LADDGKYFRWIQPATGALFRGLFHSLSMAAQKRIHIPLLPYVRWHRCLIFRAQRQATL
jgi:hypothetical protein